MNGNVLSFDSIAIGLVMNKSNISMESSSSKVKRTVTTRLLLLVIQFLIVKIPDLRTTDHFLED